MHDQDKRFAPKIFLSLPASRAVRMDMQQRVTLTAELEPFYEVDVMAKKPGTSGTCLSILATM